MALTGLKGKLAVLFAGVAGLMTTGCAGIIMPADSDYYRPSPAHGHYNPPPSYDLHLPPVVIIPDDPHRYRHTPYRYGHGHYHHRKPYRVYRYYDPYHGHNHYYKRPNRHRHHHHHGCGHY